MDTKKLRKKSKHLRRPFLGRIGRKQLMREERTAVKREIQDGITERESKREKERHGNAEREKVGSGAVIFSLRVSSIFLLLD